MSSNTSFQEFFKALSSGCSCHKSKEEKDSLYSKLSSKATVVTMEPKYATISYIAEFWCTITSVFFALPLLVLQDYSFSTLPDIVKASLFLSALCASTSFIYHWNLIKIFSSADAAFATMMMGLNAFALSLPYTHFATSTTYLPLMTGLFVVFLVRWENTASTSVILCTIIAPVKVYILATSGMWLAVVFGVVGIGCFLLDRLNVAPLHSFWHIFGGLCMYYTVLGLLTNNLIPMI